MKKLAVGAFALLAGMSSAYASGDYAAIAAGMSGSSYVEGYPTMDSARNAAVAACRNEWGTSCSVTTAEHTDWYFAAGACDGEPYTAASQQSAARARELVVIKAAADGRNNCRIYANH